MSDGRDHTQLSVCPYLTMRIFSDIQYRENYPRQRHSYTRAAITYVSISSGSMARQAIVRRGEGKAQCIDSGLCESRSRVSPTERHGTSCDHTACRRRDSGMRIVISTSNDVVEELFMVLGTVS